jgi:Putative phage holin Dp-1
MGVTKTVPVTTNGTEREVTVLSESTYNLLKKIVQFILPATASLYFGLSQIWGLPAGEQVVGTIALLTTFFGVVLAVSSGRYNESDAGVDGEAIVTEDPGGLTGVTLALNSDPELLVNQQKMTFRVKKHAV